VLSSDEQRTIYSSLRRGHTDRLESAMTSTPYRLHLLLSAVLMSIGTPCVYAQTYPTRQIRVVIPFNAGGATDVPARILVEKLSETFRQQLLVENRPGAGSTIGAALVAKAPADGYTILISASTHVISPHLYKSLPYHAVNDFAPLMQIGVAPSVLVVHPSLPVTSVRDLIALAKSRPGQIDFASSGVGTAQHLFAELFQLRSGTKMHHIPYQSAAPSIDVISGRVQVWFPGMALALPHVKSGRLRALGTTGAQRSKRFPEVPAIAEAGVHGYAAELWHGVLAPRGTPPDIIARLHAEMDRALKLPEVENRFLASGNDVVATNPEQFGALLKTDFDKWGVVVRASHAALN
jgi:tripartite-type tricarboxylate transporter receptor subunit TctC